MLLFPNRLILTMKFDLIVIGSGAGLNVASAVSGSMKVALVEKGPLGGTCLNVGCIPSKILIHGADIADLIRRAGDFGIKINGSLSIDFPKVMKRIAVVRQDSADIEKGLHQSENITLFKGEARFTGPKKLLVNGEEITADRIVIAAGTRPSIPPIQDIEDVPYMTSDDVFGLKELPPELIVMGGGYISCELAHFFRSMGSKVTVLQRSGRVLRHEDEEISQKFTGLFAKQLDLRLNFQFAKVGKKGDRIIVYDKDGNSAEGSHLLVVTGRRPNTDILDVAKAGVETDEKGFVKTNEYLETNVPGIWALGDIAGKYQFRHSANLESQYVIHNLLNPGHKAKVDYTAMPHAVFSSPQIAGVGATEQELKEKKKDYLVGRYSYKDTGMGLALEEKDGFVKFLADYDGSILGCHIIGPEASTLIHEVLVSMKAGSSNIKDIVNTIHIHPALSEVVQRAANDA